MVILDYTLEMEKVNILKYDNKKTPMAYLHIQTHPYTHTNTPIHTHRNSHTHNKTNLSKLFRLLCFLLHFGKERQKKDGSEMSRKSS